MIKSDCAEECVTMPDYKKMYFQLAAKVENAVDILVEAQQLGENDYIEGKPLLVSLADGGSKSEDGEQK